MNKRYFKLLLLLPVLFLTGWTFQVDNYLGKPLTPPTTYVGKDGYVWGYTESTGKYTLRAITAGMLPAHHTTHEDGGVDEISVAGLAGLLADPQTVIVQSAGVTTGTRKRISFSGTPVTVTDNPGQDRVDIEISATGSSSTISVDQDNVTIGALTSSLDFRTFFTVVDQGGGETSVTMRTGSITDTQVAAANKDGAAGTASMRTLGTAAGTAAAGTHATQHKHGGADEVATATPAANAIPKADGSNKLAAAWLTEVLGIADLSDVTLTTPATHHVLVFNNTAWVNAALAGDVTGTLVGNTYTLTIGSGKVTSGMVLDGTLLNADVNASAAIAYSKLNLVSSIVNADLSASAAIALTKLQNAVANNRILASGASGAGSSYVEATLAASLSFAANVLTVATGGIGSTELASTAVNAASYGSATQVGTFTVDADGRLTAAANSTIQVSSWSHERNLLINGDWSVWQDGTSFTADGYTADQWSLVKGTGAAVTVSRQTHTVGEPLGAGNGEPRFFCRLDRGTTGSTTSTFFQPVEDVRTASGQTITISFWLRASAGTPKVDTVVTQYFGSGGSGDVTHASGRKTHTLSTSFARYTHTVTVPSISGKTIGTDAYLKIGLEMGTVEAGAIQVDLSDAQLEPGSTATTFARHGPALQLARCRRYFEAWGGDDASQIFGSGFNYNTTQGIIYFPYTVGKYKVPSFTFSAATDFYVFSASAAVVELTAIAASNPGTQGTRISITTAGSLAAGAGTTLHADSTTSARIKANARL